MSFDDDTFEAQRGEGLLITGWPGQGHGYWAGPFDRFVTDIQRGSVQRGGIKYPTPTERIQAMEESRSYTIDEVRANNAKARSKGALKESRATLIEKRRLAELLLDQIEEEICEIDERLEKAKPAEPGPGHDRFSLLVQYGGPKSQKYEFLLLRKGKTWYTTGAGVDAKVFQSWDAVVDWIEGPNIKWHSDLQRLTLSSEAWSLESGTLVSNGNGEAPF